jgi:hypothetical protein
MSREEWQNTVNDMVQRGASGSTEELHMVVDYLANYLGPKAPVSAGSKP